MKIFYFLITLLPVTFGIKPFLSSPGNGTVLLFVDIHSGYLDNGTCTRIQWDKFELAYTLLGDIESDDNTGIEMFDTCGSWMRTQLILKERLYASSCNMTSRPVVTGIVSMTTEEVASIISSASRVADIIHIDVGRHNSPGSHTSPGILALGLASRRNVQFAVDLLQAADWDVVTTVSDQDPISLREHDMFVTSAKEHDVCIQYFHNTTDTPFDFGDVKTSGVVMFAADVEDVEQMVKRLPDFTFVLVLTHDNKEVNSSFIKNGAIIKDGQTATLNASTFLHTILTTWSSNDLVLEFLSITYNCSLNATGSSITCPASDKITKDMNTISSSRRSRVLNSAVTIARHVSRHMKSTNCSTFSVNNCLNRGITMATSLFTADSDGNLAPMSPVPVSLTRIINGTNIKIGKFNISPTSSEPEVSSWFNETTRLPSSMCTWCPGCKHIVSSNDQIYYDGSYYHYPGDILITGLFRLSTTWTREKNKICSGSTVANNTDILTEAFLFALRTAHDRYPGLLPNVAVGGLLLDTCSSQERASQVILNFESNLYKFPRVTNSWMPSPSIVPVYFLTGPKRSGNVSLEIASLGKLPVTVDPTGNIFKMTSPVYDVTAFNSDVIMKLLETLGWPYFGIVTSSSIVPHLSTGLFETAKNMNMCIEYQAVVSPAPSDISNAIDKVKDSESTVVVIIATADEVSQFFRARNANQVYKTWILVETRENWLDVLSYPLPRGTIIVQVTGKENADFNTYLRDQLTTNYNDSYNPFLKKFFDDRKSCLDCTSPMNDMQTLFEASDVIKAVDVVLHGLNATLAALCPQDGGLCERFQKDGIERLQADMEDVIYTYQDEVIRMKPDVAVEHNYVIRNIQTSGITEVGSWKNQMLQLQRDQVISYDSRGDPLATLRPSVCFSEICACANMNMSTNETGRVVSKQLDPELGYVDSSARFDTNLWSIVVVVIAASGSFFTILLMIYIMCKVCHGSLIRRYLVLGILLLVAMVFLFLSVLPFTFTPSRYVCGMRFFAHGFSYAFCFAVILSKMTTLRDYKYIGLGGEISRLNQMLSVFFVTAVQVAIGVEWWGLRPETVFEQTLVEERSGVLQDITYYACDFSRTDFIAYNSYVIFLVVLCALYSISVRKETKNMKEARLLLVCSWFCLFIWVGIVVTLLVLDRQLLEAVCAVGITANALTMLVIIYLPKITAISRLKYEVSQTKKAKENGYKIDPDFQFERPYSLPGTMGTMRSSITDKTFHSTPRSLANFDTSMSY